LRLLLVTVAAQQPAGLVAAQVERCIGAAAVGNG
jgi:hypothetical protein